MATISTDTRLRLINELSNIGSLTTNDLLMVQRSLKTYKLNYQDLVTGLADDVGIEASSNKLQLKDNGIVTSKIADSNVTKQKIENISNLTVLGNTTGSATYPREVGVQTTLTDSDTNIPTSGAVVDYVESNSIQPTPYYNVTVHQTTNLTIPSQFSTGTILSEYRYISYGSIIIPRQDYHILDNSLLYEMTIEVIPSSVNIPLKLFGVDGSLYLYLDGSGTPVKSQIWDGSGKYNNSPKDWTITLSQGIHTIQLVYNCDGTDSWIDFIGNFINQDILFIPS